MSRPGWDEYFLGIAVAVAARGDCIRCKVGAVLFDNESHWILATGYNGSPPGGPSCLLGECPRCLSDAPSGSSYEGCIERHAEENVILKYKEIFKTEVVNLSGCSLVVTREPCTLCTPMLFETRVDRIVYPDFDGLKVI